SLISVSSSILRRRILSTSGFSHGNSNHRLRARLRNFSRRVPKHLGVPRNPCRSGSDTVSIRCLEDRLEMGLRVLGHDGFVFCGQTPTARPIVITNLLLVTSLPDDLDRLVPQKPVQSDLASTHPKSRLNRVKDNERAA